MKTILVVGGGFAGLMAAIGAARELDAQGIASGEAKVALINRDPFTCIRPRNYERDLSEVRVPWTTYWNLPAWSESRGKLLPWRRDGGA
jgi:NADH:ubiquinone reductase (H+-translocating)